MKTTLALLGALLVLSPGLLRAIQISYRYDAAGRMTAANYDGTSRSAYVYDKNGSLLSRTNTVTPALAAAPHLAGTYNGLITNADPHAGNTGIITLKILANGTFTGKLTVQGIAFSIKGKFLANGSLENMHIIIDRKAPLLDYLLSLTLDVQSGTPRITGNLSGDFLAVVFNSQIAMQQDLYSSGASLLGTGFIGKYTLLLQPTENTAGIPQGSGYAIVTVSAKGGITLAGKLANNIAITQGSQIIGINHWPLFVSLHNKLGYIAGNISFFIPGDDHLSGDLDWLKPDTTGTFHPAGFATELGVSGSRYVIPGKGQRALDFAATSPNAVFEATQGNLVGSLIKNVTLDTANKFFIPADAAALKAALATATGLVIGSFKVSPTITRSFSGVVHQDDNEIQGFFPGSTESGHFSIGIPAP